MQVTLGGRRITGEILGLLSVGFVPYSTITLWCEDHGFIRVNVSAIEECPTQHPCPICGAVRACGVLQSIGYTRQPLPTFDVVLGPLSDIFKKLTLASLDESTPAPEKTELRRHCDECGLLFSADHGNQRLCGDLCSSVRDSRRAAKRYAARTAAAVVTV